MEVVTMSDVELELGAVPADDRAYGEAVTDEEFERWVLRSQQETDALLEEWDLSDAAVLLCDDPVVDRVRRELGLG